MTRLIAGVILAGLLLSGCAAKNGAKTAEQKAAIKALAEKLEWLGTACFKLDVGGRIILIDPQQVKTNDQADLVLVTHGHTDHFYLPDYQKFKKDGQVFISGFKSVDNALLFQVGMKTNIMGIDIEAVPA